MKNQHSDLSKSLGKAIEHYGRGADNKKHASANLTDLRTLEMRSLFADPANTGHAQSGLEHLKHAETIANLEKVLAAYPFAFKVEEAEEGFAVKNVKGVNTQTTEMSAVLHAIKGNPARLHLNLDKANGQWVLFENAEDAEVACSLLFLKSMAG